MLDPAIFASGAITGAMAQADVEALQKALTAGYGTNAPELTGGAALRVQSLDPVMQVALQTNKHFVLFNRLPKTKPLGTVDEWTEQDDIGGFLGGSTNTETGVIRDATGAYQRMVGMVKFLMARRQVSLVVTLQKAIADAEATEYSNGAKQLLSDLEYLLFEGDDGVVPTEFSGIKAQLLAGVASGRVPPENIIDMDGKPLESQHELNAAAAHIAGYGQFGTATDLFMNQATQQDFDNRLDPAYRVPLSNVGDTGAKIGAPVVGIRTSNGNIATNQDVFIRHEGMKRAFQLIKPAIAAANAGMTPTSVTTDATGNAADSKFTTARAGTYVYGVAGVSEKGASTVSLTGQIAVAAGKKVVLTIAASAAGQETGYVIYRGRQNGPAAVADLREVCRIPRVGATTTFEDVNRIVPGSQEAYVLNLSPGDTAITFRQLMPMLKWQLYPTDSPIIPWAQMYFGFLRMSKRKQHVMVRNIVTRNQVWRPFADE
ncbi:conserved protein of unknown function (plasmid) [Rhodovastum atsumiense]|uniref:Uncharacterized protein n=1 Tax=Rhodovastum atsumiense TaxID=504468 RepID=A0A5M6ITK3_9PROT|nr:hypothetical protein [Rhodovastum atsumiense]KAA5611592.1 hypothetical protein F1189_13590 [Rhodovastum atsumiense]CAH2606325.1 conserved protein of unknown function [Rhodovastum atsumiense]